jgi:16S rRNA (uracil1498-N3)-methyltransferase
MSKHPKIRLYTTSPLSQGLQLEMTSDASHYLANVMRRKSGENILLFNGKDGEWLAQITDISRKHTFVRVIGQTRPQADEPDIWLCFAPVKNAPINNLVQKATELGVSVLQPVITQHTITNKVNTERLAANAIEAAEQSERLTVPEVMEPIKLDAMLSQWPADRNIILCDESGGGTPFIRALSSRKGGLYAILIGPEGGFSQTEFEILRKTPYIIPVGMGPRILRADTAAIAALTCYMSILGDWDAQPHFEQRG